MIAYVTSVDEPTENLCHWSLERNGFFVKVIHGQDSLASKLKTIYNDTDEDFLRVDADIIVNRHLTPDYLEVLKNSDKDIWWWQFIAFDWYKLDIAHCMSFVRKEALPALRENIGRFQQHSRPETEVSRIEEFYNPRRFKTYDKIIMGLHGYGIKNIEPVKKLKEERGQSDNYDFEMAGKLNAL